MAVLSSNLRPMKVKVLFLICAINFTSLTAVTAADCESACVDVYTQDGQLIFEARKGSGSKASAAPKPKAKAVIKPKVVAKPKAVIKPKVSVPKKKATPKKRAPVAVAATSLSDRISKSLPTGGIAYQPNFQPLINVPVYFWNDMPAIFHSKVDLIGEVIDVTMRPSFTWSFGDGGFKSTTDPGGPYPNGQITHSYSRAGTYPVLLVTTWGGTFAHNGIERAITGEIKKTTALTITVVAAPTRFTN